MSTFPELDEFQPTTADGAALKEVAQILCTLNASNKFGGWMLDGVMAYLKSRYRQPAYIMTPDDLDPVGN